jgi:plastocyanin domain-containing protein
MLETLSNRLRRDGHVGDRDRALGKTRVRVRGGYEPETVYVRAGEPVAIVFRREETAPCSERVIFPVLGKSAMLPAFEDVTVELTPLGPGEYEFTCQLGVLRGRLVVVGETMR